MSKFSDIEQFFHEADINKDGCLTMEEVTKVLKKSGFKRTKKEIKEWFKAIDKNCDNKITLAELKAVYANISPKEKKASQCLKMFQEFDLDGSGFINASELGEALRKMGQEPSAEVLGKMIAKVDKDGDGKINYEEFITLMS